MSAIGLCPHNNPSNYCPSCLVAKGNSMNGRMNGAMGYDFFGINVPNSGELLNAANAGLLSAVGQTAATSPSVVTGAKTATGNAIGQWVLTNWKPLSVGAVVLAIAFTYLATKKK